MSLRDLSSQMTLKELNDVLKKSEVSTIVERARKYLGFEAGGHGVQREDGDEKVIPEILMRLSEGLVLKGDLWTKEVPKELKPRIQKTLETIELIDSLSTASPKTDDTFLLRLTTCIDSRDPWTTLISSEIAGRLCQRYSSILTSPDFLIDQILKNTIRPLFSKSRPSTITPSARKAINPPVRAPNEPTDIDPSTKPWKFEFPATIMLFRWAIDHTDTELLTQNWPLFIPPLLTFLDDPTPAYRSMATNLLNTLLQITPPTLLKQTGLGEVFTEAVFPTLHYLPSLTPTPESLLLLQPAYVTLYTLADLLYPSSSQPNTKDADNTAKNATGKQKFYDRILREGVFTGYLYAHEDIQILEVLVKQLGILVQKMGIQSVKHLMQILPILTHPLNSPFLLPPTIPPTLLLTTLQTIQLLIQNTWPRISEPRHRNVLLKALCVCWIHVQENGNENNDKDGDKDGDLVLEDIKKELKVTAMLLIKAMKAMEPDLDVRAELGLLVGVGVGIEELLFGLE